MTRGTNPTALPVTGLSYTGSAHCSHDRLRPLWRDQYLRHQLISGRLPLAVSTLFLYSVVGTAAAPLASVYTQHDFAACRAQLSPHPGVVEVRRCRGLGGIPIIWTSEPDASWLKFGPSADAKPIPSLDTFYAVRGTVEWRGLPIGGGIRPVAAIVRYDTGPSIRLGTSRLVAYRLAPGGACIMGVINGATPDANVAARELVDRAAAGFVCRRSKVRTGSAA